MTSPHAPEPTGRPAAPRPDPVAMTPGEKVAAEWEARHDVAARGRRSAPDGVQHYLAAHRAGATPPAAPEGGSSGAGPASQDAALREAVAVPQPAPAAPPAPGRWWQRLRRHH